MSNCVQPRAPIVSCGLCGMDVHTCERADGPDYRCPERPDGAQMRDGAWVCSPECGDSYIELWGDQSFQHPSPAPSDPTPSQESGADEAVGSVPTLSSIMAELKALRALIEEGR